MMSRARLRRYAAWVLVLWVFGLAAGFANACIVAAEVRHASHAMAQSAHGHAHAHEQAAESGDQPAPADAGQRPCERLCAELTTASRHEKQSVLLSGFFVVAPVAIHEVWLPPQPPKLLARAAPSPRNPIPLPITYVRLTL